MVTENQQIKSTLNEATKCKAMNQNQQDETRGVKQLQKMWRKKTMNSCVGKSCIRMPDALWDKLFLKEYVLTIKRMSTPNTDGQAMSFVIFKSQQSVWSSPHPNVDQNQRLLNMPPNLDVIYLFIPKAVESSKQFFHSSRVHWNTVLSLCKIWLFAIYKYSSGANNLTSTCGQKWGLFGWALSQALHGWSYITSATCPQSAHILVPYPDWQPY